MLRSKFLSTNWSNTVIATAKASGKPWVDSKIEVSLSEYTTNSPITALGKTLPKNATKGGDFYEREIVKRAENA